jgi:hypothetical protein
MNLLFVISRAGNEGALAGQSVGAIQHFPLFLRSDREVRALPPLVQDGFRVR